MQEQADAIYLIGLQCYYTDELAEAIQHFDCVRALIPNYRNVEEVLSLARRLQHQSANGNV